MTIPGTFGSLVAFLFFLAPGVLWNQLRRGWRTPAERSSFQEISVVALFGTAFSSVSTAITLGFAELFHPGWYNEVQDLIDGKQSARSTGLTLPAVLAAIELLLSAVLVVIAFVIARQFIFGAEKLNITAWAKVIDDPPSGSLVYAVAQLSNGSEVRGQVVGHDLAGPSEDRHLILGKPIAVRSDPNAAAGPVALPYERLVLQAASVSSLGVIYGTPPGPQANQ